MQDKCNRISQNVATLGLLITSVEHNKSVDRTSC